MAALAVAAEASVMDVLLQVAVDAVRWDAQIVPLDWIAVTAPALEPHMGPFGLEALCAAVIEAPECPVVGVVAALAALTEAALMIVLRPVAADAILFRIFVGG